MRTFRTYAAGVKRVFTGVNENFGDNLMRPLMTELFGVEPRFVDLDEAELIGAGSILDSYWRRSGGRGPKLFRRRPWRTLHVWGSGFMSAVSEASWPQRLALHAVRGGPSRARLAGAKDCALGDPGILLPLIWPAPTLKTADVLVVPHFATLSAFEKAYLDRLPKNWRIQNLLEEPRAVARAIASAEFVVSSSLHGLIVADAYGVPSCWIAPTTPIKGDGFKFADYADARGAALLGPMSFDEVLAAPGRFRQEPSAAARPPSAAATEALVRAFPFV